LEVNAVMFAPDGHTLWTTGDDGSLCQWEVPNGRLRRRILAHSPGKAFNLLRPNDSDKTLISVGSDGRAGFWNAANGDERGSAQLHDAAVAAIDSDPAGRRIYSAGKDHRLRMLSLPDRQFLETADTGINFPITMISLRDGLTAVVSESGPRVQFWHPAKHSFIELHEFRDDVRVLLEHSSEPFVFGIDAAGVLQGIRIPPAAQFPPNGRLRLPDQPSLIARLHSGRVYTALISQNQQSLITCGEEGAVRSWSIADLSPSFVSRFADAQQVIRMIGPSYDGKVVFALAEDAVLSINPDDLSIREAMPLTADRSRQAERLLPDNSMLTVEREENGQHRLVLRKFTDGKTQQDVELGGLDNEPHDIDCDPRLRLIVVGDLRAPHCHFVSMDTFEPLKPLRVRVAPKHVDVSPERSLLAVSQNRRIEVYDLSSRNLIWSQQAPANVSQLKFLDQANCLISVTVDRVIRKWDAASGALLGDMTGHRSSIIELLASRDGRTLISGSHGPEVMFWHVSTCELLGQMAPVENDLASLMLSADEDRLLILDRTKRLRSLSVRP
jgi:WD40 repeat protein